MGELELTVHLLADLSKTGDDFRNRLDDKLNSSQASRR